MSTGMNWEVSKTVGRCGVGSAPSATTCAISAAVMTTAWTTIEQSVKERRMAPPVMSSLTHDRLDTMRQRRFRRSTTRESSGHAPEHVVHHLRRQLAGIGVLPARVIAADERLSVGELMGDAVTERRARPHRD